MSKFTPLDVSYLVNSLKSINLEIIYISSFFSGDCDTMPWYIKADWVLFNVGNTAALLVSLLYWILLYGRK